MSKDAQVRVFALGLGSGASFGVEKIKGGWGVPTIMEPFLAFAAGWLGWQKEGLETYPG